MSKKQIGQKNRGDQSNQIRNKSADQGISGFLNSNRAKIDRKYIKSGF